MMNKIPTYIEAALIIDKAKCPRCGAQLNLFRELGVHERVNLDHMDEEYENEKFPQITYDGVQRGASWNLECSNNDPRDPDGACRGNGCNKDNKLVLPSPLTDEEFEKLSLWIHEKTQFDHENSDEIEVNRFGLGRARRPE